MASAPSVQTRELDRAQEIGSRSWSDRRIALGLFVLLFVTFAYFYQGGGWNENSRMDLARALVEDHALSIDRLHHNTGDKAKFGGHYYSDKAPGLSFLAAPVYALVLPLREAFVDDHAFVVFASYIVTAFVVGGSTALLGVLLYFAGRRLGATARGSGLATVAYGLGTTAFPYSTVLFSHQVAATALFFSFMLLWGDRQKPAPWRSMLAGLVAAGAAVIEFPSAPVFVILLAYHARGARRRENAGFFLLGGMLPVVLVGLYLTLAFDSPLRLGYGLLAQPTARSAMLAHGIFGVTFPKPAVLLELVAGRYRGLLPFSPVVILAAVAFAKRGYRPERVAAAAVVAYYFLFVSSYEWWQGGSSFGSRHLGPMLPFLFFPLARVADARPKLTALGTLVSIGFMLVVTAVQPKPSDVIRDPFFAKIWPAFQKGHLAVNNVCPLTGLAKEAGHRPLVTGAVHDAFNLGMVLGGRGKRSLVPLFGFWLGIGFALYRGTRLRDEQEST
jgi:hypothetical protein